MADAVCGSFATRRTAELAVEHLVQEHGVDRAAVTVRPAGAQNSAGVVPAGADVQSGHPGVEKEGDAKLGGMIEVRVGCGGVEREAVASVLREAGAQDVRAA